MVGCTIFAPSRKGVIAQFQLDPAVPLVYVTGGTPLVRKARSLGLRTADGWEILLLQGAMAFEKWWTENRADFTRWLRAIGKLEEICSFASLLHDNPNWTFPRFAAGDRVVAEGLGHPMIPEKARVDNNASVGPPGRILMVTGSNMSGKTTLLRAIGINVLLAKAGGPVCAKELELPWVEVVTSMRAMDSLTEGVSLFMAELSSIKVVIEAAHRATQKCTGMVLYLLDEVLLGTNIDERRVITCRLIRANLSSPPGRRRPQKRDVCFSGPCARTISGTRLRCCTNKLLACVDLRFLS